MTFDPYSHYQGLEGNQIDPAVVFFDDFITGGYAQDAALANESDPGGKFSPVADRGEWLVTLIDGGGDAGEVIAIRDNVTGGVLRLTANDADNDGISIQLNGSAFKVADGSRMLFAIRVAVVDISETDWFVGLAAPDTAILSGVTESIGFRCPDSTGDIDYVVENASTETTGDTGSDLADATFVELAFEVIGNSRVKFFVDGVFKAAVSTNIPDTDDLSPVIEVRNDGAVAQSIDVDWIYVRQENRA